MSNVPHGKIADTADAWEVDGQLGNEEQHTARATDDISAAVDAALGLQPISIRLQRGLLDNLKALAQLNGIGYQPLIRQVLTRFVDCELKALLNDKVAREVAERTAAEDAPQQPQDEPRLAA
jgi:hypothetical protein